jgi:hypothetical protein
MNKILDFIEEKLSDATTFLIAIALCFAIGGLLAYLVWSV